MSKGTDLLDRYTKKKEEVSTEAANEGTSVDTGASLLGRYIDTYEERARKKQNQSAQPSVNAPTMAGHATKPANAQDAYATSRGKYVSGLSDEELYKVYNQYEAMKKHDSAAAEAYLKQRNLSDLELARITGEQSDLARTQLVAHQAVDALPEGALEAIDNINVNWAMDLYLKNRNAGIMAPEDAPYFGYNISPIAKELVDTYGMEQQTANWYAANWKTLKGIRDTEDYYRRRQDFVDQYGQDLYDLAAEMREIENETSKNPYLSPKTKYDYSKREAEIMQDMADRGMSQDEIRKMLQYVREIENAKTREQSQQEIEAFMKGNPWATIAANAADIITSPVQGIFPVIEVATSGLRADPSAPIDTNSQSFALSNFSRDVQNVTNEEIGNEVGQFFYGVGSSTAKSVLSMMIGAGVGEMATAAGASANAAKIIQNVVTLPSFGGTAFATTLAEANERGMGQEQAIEYATAAGLFEMAFEVASLDKAYGMIEAEKLGKRVFVDRLLDAFSQAAIEGSEEVFTDIANNIADRMINADWSEYERMIAEGERAGLTREEAVWRANEQFQKQLAQSMAAGALSGFVSTGATAAIGKVQSNVEINELRQNPGQIDVILESARENAPVSSAARNIAEARTAETITNGELQLVIDSMAETGTASLSDSVYAALIEKGETEEQAKKDTELLMGMYSEKAGEVTEEEQAEREQAFEENENLAEVYTSLIARNEESIRRNVSVMDVAQQRAEAERAERTETQPEEVKTGATTLAEVMEGINPNGQFRNQQREAIQSAYDAGKEGKVPDWKAIKNRLGVTKSVYEMAHRAYEIAREEVARETEAKKAEKVEQRVPEQTSKQFKSFLDTIGTMSPEIRRGYENALTFAYNAGQIGTSFDIVKKNMERYKAVYGIKDTDIFKAYSLGENERKAESAKRKANPAKVQEEQKGRQRTKTEVKEGNEEEYYKKIAEKTGLKITKESLGLRTNGAFQAAAARLILNEESDKNLVTLSHELAHFGEMYDWAGYEQIMRTILDYVESEYGSEYRGKVLRDYFETYNMEGRSANMQEAAVEFVNDVIGTLMSSKEGMQDIVEWTIKNESMTIEEKQSIMQKFAEFFKRVADFIKGLVGRLNAGGRVGIELSQNAQKAEEIRAMIIQNWDNASINLQNQLGPESTEGMTEDEAVESLDHDGIKVDRGSGTVFSVDYTLSETWADLGYRSYEEAMETIARKIQAFNHENLEDIKAWMTAEESIASYILKDEMHRQYLYYSADQDYTAIKENADYPQGTVDLSNNCPKREVFTTMFANLQRMNRNTLFNAEDIAIIRDVLKRSKETIACGLCYVEDRRQRVGEIAELFINHYREALESKSKIVQTTNSSGVRKNLTYTKNQKIKYGIPVKKGETIYFYASDPYIPTQYDLTTYEGYRELRQNHPDVARAFERFNNARGMQAARLIEGHAEYKREILKWTQAQVEKANRMGGLRIFSFSDFQAIHMIDILQVLEDCAAKGVMVQAYTKNPSFARMVKDTGVKLNMSLIPTKTGLKEVNGHLVLDFDRVEGIDYEAEDYLAIDENNPNVGNILIGISDEQIRVAMADRRIDYIIPFHTGQSQKVLEIKGIAGWYNYKDYQEDKKRRGSKSKLKRISIYEQVLNNPKYAGKIQNERQFVEAFLEQCEIEGFIPRFEQFLNKDENGNYVYTEGYYKLLLDYKLFDKEGNILPQQVVRPVFDVEFMQEILDRDITRQQELVFPEEVMQEAQRALAERGTHIKVDNAREDDTKYSVEVDGEKRYIRYGEIPANERSFNFMRMPLEYIQDFAWARDAFGYEEAAKSLIGKMEHKNERRKSRGLEELRYLEDGVSVFIMSDQGREIADNADLERSLQTRREDRIKKYIVTGEEVGIGQDGEPLIRNVKIIEEVSPDDPLYSVDVFERIDRTQETIQAENETLAEMIKKGATTGSEISDGALRKVASNIKKEYKSGLSINAIEEILRRAYEYIRREDDQRDVAATLGLMAKPILESAAKEKESARYTKLVNAVSEYRFKVTKEQIEEIEDEYGSLQQFMRDTNGLIHIDQRKGVFFDNAWNRIVNEADGALNPATFIAKMPVELAMTLQGLKPSNLQYGQSEESAEMSLAYEIFRQLFVEQSKAEAATQIKEVMTKRTKKMAEEYKKAIQKERARLERERQLNIKQISRQIMDMQMDEAMEDLSDVEQAFIKAELSKLQARKRQMERQNMALREEIRAKAMGREEGRRKTEYKARIRKEVEGLERMIERPGKEASKHVPVGLLNVTVEALRTINLNSAQHEERVESIARLADHYQRLLNDKDKIYQFTLDERTHQAIEGLRRIFEDKNYTELELGELQQVYDLIKILKKQIENANVLLFEETKETVKAVGEGIIEDLKTKRPMGIVEKRLSEYAGMHLNAYREFRRLSGYNDNSGFMELYRMLDDGQMQMLEYQREMGEIFRDVLEGEENQKNLKLLTSTKEKDLVDVGLRDKQGNPFLVTRAMRLSLIMHASNESNMNHALYGGLTIPDIKMLDRHLDGEAMDRKATYKLFDQTAIMEAISQGDWDKVNEITAKEVKKVKKLKEDLSDWEREFLKRADILFNVKSKQIMNKTSEKLNGYPVARVTNYYPIVTNSDHTMVEMSGLVQDGTIAGKGYLKSRVFSRTPIFLEDITDVILRTIKNTSQYGGLAIPVRNMNMVYNYKTDDRSTTVKEMIGATWGSWNQKYIEKLVNDLQGGRVKDNDFFLQLRGKFAGATLTMNPSVAIKQTASFFTAGAVVGHKALAKAVKDIGKGFIKQQGLEELERINPLLWYRNQGNGTQELADMKASGFGKNLPAKIQKWINWTQWMDTGTVRTLEYAAKYYVDENFSELKGDKYWEKVSEVFTRIVEETQPNYTVMQQASIIRSESQIIKMLVMFKTQPLQNFGVLYDALGEYNARLKEHKLDKNVNIKPAAKKLANAITSQIESAIVFSMFSIIADLTLHRIYKYRDDEDKLSWEKLLAAFGKGVRDSILGMILFASEIYKALEYILSPTGLTKVDYYDGLSVPSLDVINNLVENTESLTKNTKKYSDAKTDADKELALQKVIKSTLRIAQTIGEFTGVPFNNLKNIIQSIVYYSLDAVDSVANGELDISNDHDITTWNVTNQYDRIMEAMINGDDDEYERLVQQLVDASEAKDPEKSVNAKIKNLIKEVYTSGEIDDAEVYLKEKLGMSNDEAFYQEMTWDTGSTSDYAAVDQAIENALKDNSKRSEIVSAVRDLMRHGKNQKQIKNNLKSKFGKQIKNADVYSMCRQALMAAGYNDDEAKEILNSWK